MTRVYLCDACLTLAGQDPARVGFTPADDEMTCWHCGKIRKCYPFTRNIGKVPGVYVFTHAQGLPLPLFNPEDND